MTAKPESDRLPNKGKEDIIAVHIMPYFKNLKVNEIQPMNVRRWQTELMNNQKNYKPTYLRTLNSQLSAIFNFAVKYYGLGSNPVQKAELSVKRILAGTDLDSGRIQDFY